jgi:hypothetical protein
MITLSASKQFMSSTAKTKRLMFLENITHYLTALVVIIKGLDKIDTPGKMSYGILFLIMGLLIAVGTLFHHKAEKLLKHFKAYVLIFEAVIMGIVGYLYVKEGKHLLQYVCFAASMMFVVALVIYITKSKSHPKAHAH